MSDDRNDAEANFTWLIESARRIEAALDAGQPMRAENVWYPAENIALIERALNKLRAAVGLLNREAA